LGIKESCPLTTNLIKGYVPGAIGRIVELHASYYYPHAGFGLFFEGKVARELSEFLSRYNEKRDGLWLAIADGRVEGSIVIDGLHADEEGAHLRWFIVSDCLRGNGLGNALLATALDFCRSRRYERVHLWTFEGLHAARHLYEKYGFQLTEQKRGEQWGVEVNEQRFDLRLPV
jgi:GNAT superfamily N-acetyltransferase